MYNSRLSKPLSDGNGKVPSAPQAIQGVLSSPGRPLDTASRAYFEPRFRHDFSHVRVHTDFGAARSASAIAAQAYTAGNHIVFAEGTYAPGSAANRRLMAHELAHVIQQERGGPVAPVTGDPSLEVAAEQVADGVTRSGQLTVAGSAGIGIARQPQSSSGAQEDFVLQQQRQKDILVLLRLGISLDKLVDFFQMTRGDFMSKYGFSEYFRFRKVVRKAPIGVLARMTPHGDQTEYLQPSGRIATDADEKATQLRDFDPGTPVGGVAYAGARALGASHETAKLSQAFGDLANAGLATPGSASQGATPTQEESQSGAPLAPPPEHVAEREPPGTSQAAQPGTFPTATGEQAAQPAAGDLTPVGGRDLPQRGTRQKPVFDWRLAPSDKPGVPPAVPLGGPHTGMGHVDYRHAWWSRQEETSKFTQEAWSKLPTLVDEAVQKGTLGTVTLDNAGKPQAGVVYEYTFGFQIGVDRARKKKLFRIRVVVDANNHITTLFPR